MQPDGQPNPFPVSRWRRATTVVAFVAAFSVAVAACGDDDDTTATATVDATTTQEASPSAEASTTSEAGALPDNAQDYADATFQAWLDGDQAALEQMAVADAVTALEANTPGDSSSWSMSGCDAGTGQVECTYTSTGGDTLTLLVDNAMASGAEPQAVVEARFS